MISNKDIACEWQNKLSVIIPVFNEKNGVSSSVARLQEFLPEAEIIIVNDGSTDGSSQKINALNGVKVINHNYNKGYGAALKSGMKGASREIVAWYDADNEHRVEDLINVVDTLVKKDLVATIGQRPVILENYQAIGKLMIFSTARLLGLRASGDLNCGLRAFRRDEILPYLSLLPDKFSASLTSTMIMLESQKPLEFVPITVNPRIGISKVRLVDGFSTFAMMLRMIMLFAPLRIFLTLGFGLIASGAGYGIWLTLLNARGIPTLSVIVIISGVVLILQGLIADQLSSLILGRVVKDREKSI